MNNGAAFSYAHGNSWLHRVDVRCKFTLLCLISLSVLHARLPSLGLSLFLFVFLFYQINYNLVKALKQIRMFVFLIFLVFVIRAVTIPGKPVASFPGVIITDQGLFEGSIVACRFFIIILTGMLFYITTKPSEIKSTIQWILKPIPFIPEKRVAVMASLTFSFLPVILKRAGEIKNAQDARCAQYNRNPIKRMVQLSLPLLKKTFQSADQMILAMEARCYSEDRTDPEFFSSGLEMQVIIGGLSVIALLLLF